jgi:hypothetical protein
MVVCYSEVMSQNGCTTKALDVGQKLKLIFL